MSGADVTVVGYTWCSSTMEAKVTEEEYSYVAVALTDAIDVRRDPRAINWCTEFGYRRGHVPVLWHVARNLLRFSNGRVPSCDDLAFGVRCGMLLLLRTAQDVMCCRVDLARSDLDHVYVIIWSYVQHWVVRWNGDVLPAPAAVADDLAAWSATVTDLPLPSWATAFEKGILGGLYWNKPRAVESASFRRCSNLADTRAGVTAKLIEVLRCTENWKTVFEAVRTVGMLGPTQIQE